MVEMAIDKIRHFGNRGRKYSILPISTPLEGQYGLKDVALSVPCILNNQGVRTILEIEMSDDERKRLQKSGEKLKKILVQLELRN